MSRRFTSPAALSAAIVMVVTGFVVMAICFWSFTAEDAFIVFRYAENFADGKGLTFNEGEAVSALTSPLHALTSTSLYVASGATLLANKIAAMLAVLSACLMAVHSELRYRSDRLWALVLILLSPFIVLWTVGGLETPFLTALALVSFSLTRRCLATPSRSNATSLSLTLGLMVLTRYDAVLFAAPVMASVLWGRLRPSRGESDVSRTGSSRFSFVEFLGLVLPGCLTVCSWLLVSSWYYDDILPTSYYHKRPSFSLLGAMHNLIYMAQLGLYSWTGLIAIALVVGKLRKRKLPIPSLLEYRWGCWLGVAAVVGYGTMTATTHMMFGHRMLVPYLPIVVLLLLEWRAADRCQEDASVADANLRWRWLIPVIASQIALTVVVDRGSVNPGVEGEYQRLSRRDYLQFIKTLEVQADAIESHWQQRGESRPPRVFTYAAGVVPYRLKQAHILDTGLISFRHEFPHGNSGIRASADYVLTLTPRHGKLRSQLAPPRIGNYVLVFEQAMPFDGRTEDFAVYFNPRPSEQRLSPRVR